MQCEGCILGFDMYSSTRHEDITTTVCWHDAAPLGFCCKTVSIIPRVKFDTEAALRALIVNSKSRFNRVVGNLSRLCAHHFPRMLLLSPTTLYSGLLGMPSITIPTSS